VLWNVLGGRADGEVIADVRRVILSSGDAIVLCSDGLHRYVDAKMISDVVTTSNSPAEACQRLIKLANEAGGEDNITVVVSKPEFKDLGDSTWVDDAETQI
jgi:serine/threonine protein phosphatase PrpC